MFEGLFRALFRTGKGMARPAPLDEISNAEAKRLRRARAKENRKKR